MRYTLVGFAAELDWRPLQFVKPIPKNRICSACGAVRRMVALLPCMHLLCPSCYEKCEEEGVRSCPLDGQSCLDEDADWKETSAEELLKKEVKCWNEEHGCKAVIAASEIFQHFQGNCGHHSAHCPKCSVPVLCSDVCAHLRSNCSNLSLPPARECEGQAVRSDQTHDLTPVMGVLEEKTEEMKALLERLDIESRAQTDRLNEISYAQNACTETLKQELRGATRQICGTLTESIRQITASNEEIKSSTIDSISTRIGQFATTFKGEFLNLADKHSDDLSRLAAAVDSEKSDAKKCNQKTLDCVSAVLRENKLQVEKCEFFVKGVKSLEEVERTGLASYASEQVNLRGSGHVVSPGIGLAKVVACVNLHLLLHVHKGDMNDVVQWPLEQHMRLSIVHPKDGIKCQIEQKLWRPDNSLMMPLGPHTKAIYYSSLSLDFAALIRDGYAYEDQLRVKFEFL